MTKYTVKQSFYDEQLGQFSKGDVIDSENFQNSEAFSNAESQGYLVEGEQNLYAQEELERMQRELEAQQQAFNSSANEQPSPQIPNAQAQGQVQASDVTIAQEVKRANRKAND